MPRQSGRQGRPLALLIEGSEGQQDEGHVQRHPMAIPVVVPRLGESVTNAILVQWLKKDGEVVAKDEPVCLLETDKANVDLPAPAAGVLKQTSNPGDTVAVGEAVAQIEASVGASVGAA